MEEYLWSKEPFITNINIEWLQYIGVWPIIILIISMVTNLLSDGINTFINLKPFFRFLVIFSKLLSNIGTNVTEFLLQKEHV